MGVRHHPFRRVDETGAFDPLGTRRRDPADLQDAGCRGLHGLGVVGRGVGRFDRHDLPPAEAGEDLGEAVLVDESAQVGEGVAHGVRHGRVDGPQDFGAADVLGEGGERGPVDRRCQQPCHEQHRDTGEHRAGHRVDGLARPPGEPVAQGRAERGGGDLPDQGEAEDDENADDGALRLRIDHFCERCRDVRAEDTAAEEPDEGQRPDHEALPVAGHGKNDHSDDQDEVKNVEHFRLPGIR